MLLIAAGFVGCQSYVAEAFGLPRDSRGNLVTENYMTPTEGIFAAGDVRSKLCRQVITAAGDGATAAQAAFVFLEQLHV